MPSYADETDDKISMINIQKLTKELEVIEIMGKKYFIKKDSETEKTGILYDYDGIKSNSQIIVGKLIKDKKGKIKKVQV